MQSVVDQIRETLLDRIRYRHTSLKMFLQLLSEEWAKLPLSHQPGKVRRWFTRTPHPQDILKRLLESPVESRLVFDNLSIDELHYLSVLLDSFVADACDEADNLVNWQVKLGKTYTLRTMFNNFEGITIFDRYLQFVAHDQQTV